MMRRRKDATLVVNFSMTLVNIENGKLVKRRKNKSVLVLPPLNGTREEAHMAPHE